MHLNEVRYSCSIGHHPTCPCSASGASTRFVLLVFCHRAYLYAPGILLAQATASLSVYIHISSHVYLFVYLHYLKYETEYISEQDNSAQYNEQI